MKKIIIRIWLLCLMLSSFQSVFADGIRGGYPSNTLLDESIISKAVTAQSVKILDPSGKNITGKNRSIHTSTIKLSAVAKPVDASQEFVWESSDTEIAGVDSGKVEFYKPGQKVTITAKAKDGSEKSASVNLTYNPLATSVGIKNSADEKITRKTVNINTKTYQLKAFALPEEAQQGKFTWKSSNKNTALVSPKGKVTFLKTGTVTITATTQDGSKKSAWVKLTYSLQTKSVRILNQKGKNITGDTVAVNTETYKLSAATKPKGALQQFDWASSDKSVAKVDSSGEVTFKKLGTVTITATTKDGSGVSASVTLVYAAPTTSIRIKDPSGKNITGKTVAVHTSTYQLKAVAKPKKAYQKFDWTSSDTAIAGVDSGTVSFYKPGSVTITATAKDDSGKSASVTLNFKPSTTAVEIQDSADETITGETIIINTKTFKLKASALPEDAEQDEFSWKSSNTDVALVPPEGKETEVIFLKPGTVTITASAKDGSGKSAWVQLTYQPVTTEIVIFDSDGNDKTEKTINTHLATYNLKAVAKPDGAKQEFDWTSSKTSVADVDSGKVVFYKPGTVKITAAAKDGSGESAWVKITFKPLATEVKIKDSSDMEITGSSVTVYKDTYTLTAVALPDEAVQNFTWKSSDTETALVDPDGKVTFLKAGTVKITATVKDAGNKSGWVNLTYQPFATGVEIHNKASGKDISRRTITIYKKSIELEGVALPKGAKQEFTWKSSDEDIAVVNQVGKVTFKKDGMVIITATTRDGSKKSTWVKIIRIPRATSVSIYDPAYDDITGQTKTIKIRNYQLHASALPDEAKQIFDWKCDDESIATVDSTGMVSFRTGGKVTITATAKDGSKKSAWVILRYKP